MDPSTTMSPPVFEPLPRGEPVPDWDAARLAWKSSWSLHVYGFATAFLLFACLAAYRFCKLYSMRVARLSNGYNLKLSIYVATFLFSLLRAGVLFIDAYNSWSIFPPMVATVLWSLALPCLIGAFTILLAVLIATTNACHRGKSVASSYKHGVGMACCLMAYTMLVIAADWAAMYSSRSIFLLVVCQVFFITWGIVVMVGYAMIAIKIRRDLVRTPLNVDRSLLRSFARLLFICASVGALCILVKFYAAVGTFTSLSEAAPSPEPWPWLAFQTMQRLLECCMSLLLIQITSRADKRREIQIVPKIMCNGVTVISGLESGSVLKDSRWNDF